MAIDPITAAYAWSRYRRVMRWLMAAAMALMAVALRLAAQHAADASIRSYVVAALCVGATMLVGSTLLALPFLFRRNSLFKAPRAGENPRPARRQPDAPE